MTIITSSFWANSSDAPPQPGEICVNETIVYSGSLSDQRTYDTSVRASIAALAPYPYNNLSERKPVPDQPNSDRFKSEMPHIPGVSSGPPAGVPAPRKPPMGSPPIGMIAAVAVVVFFVVAGAHFAMRAKHADAPVAAAPPQLEVPPPAPDPAAALPHVTSSDPVIATVAEMTAPWSSKEFFMQDALTGENIQSLLIRLPSGSPTKPEGYWGLVMTAAYGSCQLEYITDMSRLRDDYGFKGATHAMIGDPCSRTVFDPTKMSALSGNIWVRGAIVQGADVRPPFGIELKIKDKNIQAIRRE